MSPGRRDVATLVVHAAAAACALAMAIAAGQPIFTDDAWWHLGLGRFFGAGGPWLDDDPLLFAAAAPAQTPAWLWDLLVAEVAALGGFDALRILHAAVVVGIVGLAWSLARRASGRAVVASAVVVLFVVLAAYRLVQLRPHLFTMGALLVLHRLLVEPGGAPPARRIAWAALLAAVWANVHAAFPLALLHLGAATSGAAVAAIRSDAARRRALRLGLAVGVVFLATLANPSGFDAYRPYFASGAETPTLGAVLDEWQSLAPWRLPVPTLPPSPLAWVVVWAVALAVVATLGRVRRRALSVFDPALLAVSALAFALQVFAVRFLWLGLFPLLWLAQVWRPDFDSHAWRTWRVGLAVVTPLAVLAFFPFGDWPMITRGLPRDVAGYARPYPATKYPVHAIDLLRDAGLRGNLYTEYGSGGFAGYWLAPGMRTLYNGTLNFSREAAEAMRAIDERRGVLPGESFPALLDRLGVDVFLGVRPPEVGPVVRPWASTLAHLERTPGWIAIYRSPRSALYLRDGERNHENLARIGRYYAARGVPFDPERGFDPERVLAEALPWCVENGVAPERFARLEHAARFGGGRERFAARDRVATLLAVLGAYERAVELDRDTLDLAPQRIRTRRRLVWSLLRLRRFEEAREAAAPLSAQPQADGLSHHLVDVAEAIGEGDEVGTDAALARLPLLYRSEVPRLLRGLQLPPPRPALGRAPREAS